LLELVDKYQGDKAQKTNTDTTLETNTSVH
jgi:hypothetical protein